MDATSPFLSSGKLWLFELIIGVFVLIIVNYLFKRFVKHVRYRSISLSSNWKEKMDYILYPPFPILLWIFGATLVVQVLGNRFNFSFFENYINAFRSTGFVFCVTWSTLRWKAIVEKRWVNREHPRVRMDTGFVQVISKGLSIITIAIALMITLRIWGLDIAPLIAFSGVGAAVVGFAGKDVLSNLFGGLMIHVNRPFVTGDFIQLPQSQLEGYVEEIGWNLTTIRDKQKRPVYLPNSTFSCASVINAARMTHRRIEEKFGVRHEDFDKIPALVLGIKTAIVSHPDIDTHLPVLVVFDGFGQSSLDLYIDVYTLQTRYEQFLRVKHEILMLVYQELQHQGAEIPNMVITLTEKLPLLKKQARTNLKSMEEILSSDRS